MRLLYLSSSVYVVISIVSFLSGDILISSNRPAEIFDPNQLGLEFSNYQNTNLYLGISIIMMVFHVSVSNIKPVIKLSAGILSGVIFFIMFTIGGRASIVAVLGVLLLCAFLELTKSRSPNEKLKVFIIAVMLVFIIGIAYGIILEYLKDTVAFWRFSIIFDDSPEGGIRMYLYARAIELFSLSLKNILIGGGIAYFPFYSGFNELGMYPHNVILELLAEYGICGTILFFLPITVLLSRRKTQLGSIYGSSPAEKKVFLIALYFWILAMFTGAMKTSWVLIFFTYLLAPPKKNVSLKRKNTGYDFVKNAMRVNQSRRFDYFLYFSFLTAVK